VVKKEGVKKRGSIVTPTPYFYAYASTYKNLLNFLRLAIILNGSVHFFRTEGLVFESQTSKTGLK